MVFMAVRLHGGPELSEEKKKELYLQARRYSVTGNPLETAEHYRNLVVLMEASNSGEYNLSDAEVKRRMGLVSAPNPEWESQNYRAQPEKNPEPRNDFYSAPENREDARESSQNPSRHRPAEAQSGEDENAGQSDYARRLKSLPKEELALEYRAISGRFSDFAHSMASRRESPSALLRRLEGLNGDLRAFEKAFPDYAGSMSDMQVRLHSSRRRLLEMGAESQKEGESPPPPNLLQSRQGQPQSRIPSGSAQQGQNNAPQAPQKSIAESERIPYSRPDAYTAPRLYSEEKTGERHVFGRDVKIRSAASFFKYSISIIWGENGDDSATRKFISNPEKYGENAVKFYDSDSGKTFIIRVPRANRVEVYELGGEGAQGGETAQKNQKQNKLAKEEQKRQKTIQPEALDRKREEAEAQERAKQELLALQREAAQAREKAKSEMLALQRETARLEREKQKQETLAERRDQEKQKQETLARQRAQEKLNKEKEAAPKQSKSKQGKKSKSEQQETPALSVEQMNSKYAECGREFSHPNGLFDFIIGINGIPSLSEQDTADLLKEKAVQFAELKAKVETYSSELKTMGAAGGEKLDYIETIWIPRLKEMEERLAKLGAPSITIENDVNTKKEINVSVE